MYSNVWTGVFSPVHAADIRIYNKKLLAALFSRGACASCLDTYSNVACVHVCGEFKQKGRIVDMWAEDRFVGQSFM